MKNCRLIGVTLSVVLLLSLFSATVFAMEGNDDSLNIDKNDVGIVDMSEEGEVENATSESSLENILTSGEMIDSLTINSTVEFSINSSSAEILSSIKSDSDFSIDGKVIDGENEYDINEYYDFSTTSKYHIAEWAYSADLISEEEKIECFCDLVLNRNFENITCLERIFDSIQSYKLNNELSIELSEKIDGIFEPSFRGNENISVASAAQPSDEETYSNAHFTVHYVSPITLENVKLVASYFEYVRRAYINLGFKTPLLQSSQSTYHVYLEPGSDYDSQRKAEAVTIKSYEQTNTCASYIIIFKFSSFTDAIKEHIAHEYFHAIQNAYNHQSGWFKEACANWGQIMVVNTTDTCITKIKEFIRGTTPMPETDGYGAVIFPLTIHQRYGGATAIRSIYEVYNGYGVSISESKLREVISRGIQNTGSEEGFEDAYLAMSAYRYNTPYWYEDVYSGASNWLSARWSPLVSYYDTSVTKEGSLAYLTSKYYKLTLPQGFRGAVKFDVEYSDTNGRIQIYTETTNKIHQINCETPNSEGVYSFIQYDVRDDFISTGIILSNVAESDTIDYSVTITLFPSGIAYGKCGLNTYWNISSDFELTIYGYGDMYDKTDYSQYPWAEYSDDIVSVTVESDVTMIAPNAFYGFNSVTNVTFENPFGWKAGDALIDGRLLRDSSFAAEFLTDTYASYKWYISYIVSGEISDTLKWYKCEDGTLLIYGSGVIPDYDVGTAPWYQYKDSITYICVFGEIEIGFAAFYEFDLVEMAILSDVTVIGQFAFYHCTNLIDINIPSSVVEIGKYAFSECYWLHSITLPSSITKIELGTFSDCLSLHYIFIPSSVTEIGVSAFYGCDALIGIELEALAGWSVGSIMFSPESLLYPDNAVEYFVNEYEDQKWIRDTTAATSLSVLNSGVCGHGAYWILTSENELRIYGWYMYSFSEYPWAEYKDVIASVSIDSDVTYIAPGAFEGCSSLEVMTVDEGNTVYYALRNCIIHAADKKIIAGCNGSLITKDENITTIGRYAFAGCDFETIYIPSTITEIEYGAFSGCTSLSSINIPKYMTCIGERVFENCTALASIDIPKNITEIGSEAFYGCTALTSVTIPSTVRTIRGGAFAYSGITSLNFLCANDWSYNNGTDDIAVSESTLENASDAVALLNGTLVNWTITRDPLMSETLTDTMGWEISRSGVLIIYGSGCMPSFASDAVPWADYAELFNALKIREGIYSIGRCAFYDLDNITTVSLPESLMVIEEYAFYDCAGFANFHIPARVFSIGAYTMRRTEVTTLTLGSSVGWSVNGIELSGDADEFYAHISGAKVDGVTLSSYKFVFKHEDITEGAIIASGEFANGTMTWTINEKGLLVITGSGAMPEFSTNETPWVDYKSIIRYVSIGEGITTVGRCSFFDCFNLEGVTFSSTVVSINEYAFVDCTSLTEIEIPSTVTSVAENAFDGSGVEE